MAAIVGLSPRMMVAGVAPAADGAAAASRELAESALAILLRRRNSGAPAVRMVCRALVRRWVAVARGVA